MQTRYSPEVWERYVTKPASQIRVRDWEMVLVKAVSTRLVTQVSANRTSAPMLLACPETTADVVVRRRYVQFESATPVRWSTTVAPFSPRARCTRESAFGDSDSNRIAEVQHRWSGTDAG